MNHYSNKIKGSLFSEASRSPSSLKRLRRILRFLFIRSKLRRGGGEQGVTLLLSVLILSAILAIAFSLATIIFIELRASGDALRTEPALYAVQTTTEEAFLNYKQLPAALRAYTASLNGVELNNPAPVVKSSPGSPLLDTIVPGSKKYQIVDASNLYAAAHFGSLRVSYLHGSGQLSIQLTEINPDPGQACGGSATLSTSLNAAPQSFFTNLDSCLQYELLLSNSGTANIDVKIDTTAKDDPGLADGQPKGLPYIGSTVLEVTANYRSLTRKYLVNIPNQ